MKYLIAGLGNIGPEYDNTRHNIGFKVLDAFAEASGTFFSTDRLALIAKTKFRGRQVVMIKPTTFMNLSGKAVNYWLNAEKIPQENLLVLVDDIALPFGTIRIRQNGSEGGHNGLKSISECLGNNNYARLRFGIGNDYPKGAQADYVLGRWSDEQNSAFEDRLKITTQAIEDFIAVGIQHAMNTFNGK